MSALSMQGEDERGYAGKVREDIDHKAYLPAAWRVDDYLEGDAEVRALTTV